MKFNFNVKSAKAWLTLAGAIISGVLGVLIALGVAVPADTSSTVTGMVTAILSILSALGIVTQDIDKPK